MQTKRSAFDIVCIVLSILLAAGLSAAFLYEHYQKKQDAARPRELTPYELQMKAEQEEREAYKAHQKQLLEEDSFYQKLADGFTVRALFLGDNVMKTGWTDSLCAALKDDYGKTVKNKQLTDDRSCYGGYVSLMQLDDNKQYDLAVICFGSQDSSADFTLHYESILRALRVKYEKCSVICVIENGLARNPERVAEIKELARHYRASVCDVSMAFSNAPAGQLTSGSLPNEEGAVVYSESLRALIRSKVQAYIPYDHSRIRAVNEKVRALENCLYLAAGDFEQTDDTTFTLRGETLSGDLGIDCSCMPDTESGIQLYIDGQIRYNRPLTTTGTQPEHLVTPAVSDITVEDEITVWFSTPESAELFRGLILTSANE